MSHHNKKEDDNLEESGAEEEEEYEVETILEKRVDKKGVFYKVKWRGYGLDDCTWEPKGNIANAPEKIKEFEEQLKIKNQSKKKSESGHKADHKSPNSSGDQPVVKEHAKSGALLGKRGSDDNKVSDNVVDPLHKKLKNDTQNNDNEKVYAKSIGNPSFEPPVQHNQPTQPVQPSLFNMAKQQPPISASLGGYNPYEAPMPMLVNENISGMPNYSTMLEHTEFPYEKSYFGSMNGHRFTENNNRELSGVPMAKILQGDKIARSPILEPFSMNDKPELDVNAVSSLKPENKIIKKPIVPDVGSFEKGDIPIKVVGIRPIKEENDLEILVNWKDRDNGVRPGNSKVKRLELLKRGYWLPLLEFYESKMKLENVSNFNPALLPKC